MICADIRNRNPTPKELGPTGIAAFADLFCGVGGFHYAAASLGLRCVFASDIDEACRDQYQHNFGLRPAGDIMGVKADRIPDHDILFGGFPCQPFSIMGERGGMNDSRGTLFLEILRILDQKRPRAVILENVRQFSTFDAGRTLQQVLRGLRTLGYDVDWTIMNALKCGLPQKRERTIIVGLQGGLHHFVWPEGKSAFRPLSDILEKTPDRRHYVSAGIHAKRMAAHSPTHRPAIWHENKAGNISSHPFSCALRAGASYNYLLVDGERRLTPREMLRLQGFPESFDVIGNDSQIRKQMGNAVPVPMVRAVIRSVLHAANQNTRTKQGQKARALSA
ncbi:MAG: DNA cytosine methyltransferase [Rhodobacteraceae bacterium]|nr:DNA cytosine methyltransferase [Paracoccaceae bacterium]